MEMTLLTGKWSPVPSTISWPVSLLGEETHTTLEVSLVSSCSFQKTVLSGLSKVRLFILTFSQ